MTEDLILQIRAAQDELIILGVKEREYFNFRRMSDEEIAEILDSVERQVETRKRFLGGKPINEQSSFTN